MKVSTARKKIFGASLSYRQCQVFKVEWEDCVDLAVKLGLSEVRLPVYWSDVQPSLEKSLNFVLLEKQLLYLKRSGIDVCLQVGIKSLWWPEYYYPEGVAHEQFFANENIQFSYLQYLRKLLALVKKYNNIKYIQLENEPFDPAGKGKHTIPVDFYKKELEVVSQTVRLPILTSVWIPGLHTRRLWRLRQFMLAYTGLHFYYDYQNTKLNFTARFTYWLLKLNILLGITPADKSIVSELQAMPWLGKIMRRKHIELKLYKRWLERIVALPLGHFWFWGLEFWLYRSKQFSDDSWIMMIKELTDENTVK